MNTSGSRTLTVAAAVANHRVGLDRFEPVEALEATELVGADQWSDGSPVEAEGLGDAPQRGRHPLHELAPGAPGRAAA